MQNENIKETQLKIIDGQLIGCILYVVSLLISIIIILNQRKIVLGKEAFLTGHEAQILSLANKIFILFLVIFFLYFNYEGYLLAKKTNQDTKALELQLVASILSIIIALIGLYIVTSAFQSTNLEVAEIENPFA